MNSMDTHKERRQITYLKSKEIQSMSNDEIIKHVYSEHKKTGISAEDVWEEILTNFGKQTVNDMLKGSEGSWNNEASFEGDSRFMHLGIVYVFAFGLIWTASSYLIDNKLNALEFVIIACGFISICITLFFMNLTGKNEKNFINAVNKLRRAHSVYTNRGGFKDVLGKPLDHA